MATAQVGYTTKPPDARRNGADTRTEGFVFTCKGCTEVTGFG